MSDALKPCPFCGNDKNIAIANERHDLSGGYYIACPACDASTGLRFSCGEDPRPLLVEQWNRRVPTPQAAQDQRPAVDVDALMALADEYANAMQDAGANQNSDFADRRRDGCRQEQEAHDGPRAALRAALEGLK